jgi:hypothetical protein
MDRQTKKPAVDLLCGQLDDVREAIKHLRQADSRISNDVINVRESVSEVRSQVNGLVKDVAEARMEAKEAYLKGMRPAPEVGPSEEHLLRGARLQVVELMTHSVGVERAKEESAKAMAFVETGKWPGEPKQPVPTPPGVVKAPRSRKKK